MTVSLARVIARCFYGKSQISTRKCLFQNFKMFCLGTDCFEFFLRTSQMEQMEADRFSIGFKCDTLFWTCRRKEWEQSSNTENPSSQHSSAPFFRPEMIIKAESSVNTTHCVDWRGSWLCGQTWNICHWELLQGRSKKNYPRNVLSSNLTTINVIYNISTITCEDSETARFIQHFNLSEPNWSK